MNRTIPAALAAILLSALPASAEFYGGTERDAIAVGGSLFFDTGTANGQDLSLELHGGYYVLDGFLIGGSLATRNDDVADTYELAEKWSHVNYRQYLQVFEAIRDKLRHGGYTDQASQMESVIDIFSTAARDMCRLASQVVRIIPIIATRFDCTLVEVPSTIVHEGVTYYRLLFRRQMINNRKYGSAIAIHRGNGYEIALTEMPSLASAVIKLDSQYFTQFMLNAGTTPPVTSEVALTSIQRGHVIYTDVNFDGV